MRLRSTTSSRSLRSAFLFLATTNPIEHAIDTLRGACSRLWPLDFAMNMRNTFRGALRRIAIFASLNAALGRCARCRPAALAATSAEPARKTVPLPTIFTPGAPTLVRAGVMPKPYAGQPAALCRDADRAQGDQHHQGPHRRACSGASSRGTGARSTSCPTRRRASPRSTLNFEQPNPEDSFRSMIEQVLEDVLVGGFGAIELDLTGDPARPLVLWPVDGASIRIRTDWDGNPTSPHYVQATGAFTPQQRDHAGRRRAVLHPAESAHPHAVWPGQAGGRVRNHSRISVRAPLCLAPGQQHAWCSTRCGCRT